VKLSAGYSCVLTKVAKDLGIVGVHLAGGETDGQPGRKEKEPNDQVGRGGEPDLPPRGQGHGRGVSVLSGDGWSGLQSALGSNTPGPEKAD